MSRTSQTVMVPTTEHRYCCDFCDKHVVFREPSYQRSIKGCSLCSKDMCCGHTHWYQEDPSGDHIDATICPECYPRFQEAWDWAGANAGRYEILMDVVKRRLSHNTGKTQS